MSALEHHARAESPARPPGHNSFRAATLRPAPLQDAQGPTTTMGRGDLE
ncbi:MULTISPECIES: hypothetical protein [unclassified Streptomyces]|nr:MULTISPECIES: hypothetical protein [unclassified Streptomyces]MCX4880586.1 hypothetical protein [Streptomyces sp. NBC_00847]MCX5420574.1 hypothetical protein [Streptomyces sp. NBC_00078]